VLVDAVGAAVDLRGPELDEVVQVLVDGPLDVLVEAHHGLVPGRLDGGGLDVATGQRLQPTARAVYVTPSHQFPLGVTMSVPRRLALLAWA
jgi:GntR family transcriptional regulator/MocR family aminotransferase